ncbi:MAG: SBBP repeat-containing protein, partial [Promethearchaeota archaeon]
MKKISAFLSLAKNRDIVFILGLLIVANSIIFGIILTLSSGDGVNAGNRGAGTNIDKLKGSSSGDIKLSFNTTWGGEDYDIGKGIAVDSNNNIYITGDTSSYGADDEDVCLLKYNSNGSLLWNTTWGGASYEEGKGIAVDSNNNIFITGYTDSYGAGYRDVFLLMYNSNGSLLWNTTWGGAGEDEGLGIAVDSNNNIFITGYTDSYGAGSYDAVLLKYDSNGNLLWDTTWGGASYEEGKGIAVDSNNNIYITGYTDSYGAGYYDAILLKYNSNGSLLWNTTWGGAGEDEGLGIAVDFNNNIYITGVTNSYGAGYYDAILLKYNFNGNLLWNMTWGSAGDDEGLGIAVDFNNNIYITGVTNSYGAGGYDILLLKYNNPINPPILDKIVPNPNTDGNVTLHWSSVEGASSYLVYRDTECITDISNLIAIIEISGTTYNDMGLTDGTYYYVIVAKGPGGSSNMSNCESVTVVISLPSPILDEIVPNPDTDGNITLRWSSVEGASSYL